MQAPSGQVTAPPVRALLEDGALAGEWVLDPCQSTVRLKSRQLWGLAPVNGFFGEASGHGTVSADGAVIGTFTVAAASINTKNTRRDSHLRSADFFDSGNFPDIIFTAEAIRPSGRGVTVTGALTVCGRTRPLSPGCRGVRPGRRRGMARLRGPHQPGRLRPHLESAGHGLDA